MWKRNALRWGILIAGLLFAGATVPRTLQEYRTRQEFANMPPQFDFAPKTMRFVFVFDLTGIAILSGLSIGGFFGLSQWAKKSR